MVLDSLHSFVNIFAGGRSDIKVILFFTYIAGLVISYYLFRHKKYPRLRWQWAAVSLVSTYLYGLFLHIFYALSIRVSPFDFLITANNGEISSSILWHTHIAKGSLGVLFSWLGKPIFQTADSGGAYVHTIPSILLVIGLGLIVLLLVQAVLYFVVAFLPMISRKTTWQKVLLILGYGIVSFSLVKTSIDGGIFTYGFLVSTLFLGLFVAREKYSWRLPHHILTFIGIVAIVASLVSASLGASISLLLAGIAALFLLYTAILYGSERKVRWQLLAPLLILFLCGWWLASSRDREIYTYSAIPIAEHQPLYIYSDEQKAVVRITSDKSESIQTLSTRLHKNITYLPVTIPGVTCMEKAPFHVFSTQILSGDEITNETLSHSPSPYLRITAAHSTHTSAQWRTDLTVRIHPCLPEPLSSLDGSLQAADIHNYVLVNPNFDGSNAYN